MAITIVHGDQITKSYQQLISLTEQLKAQGKNLLYLESHQLDLAKLEAALGQSTSLFNQEQALIIKELHSLPMGKKRQQLIDLILTHLDQDIILWEKKLLTAANLKKFPTSKILEFKLSRKLFVWLDALSTDQATKTRQLQLFHQALETEDEWLCLTMLGRQVRLLIQTKENQVKGAPFMISKLKNQAQKWSLKQLLDLHQKLLELDYRHKTSRAILSLAQELDLLLLNL